MKSVLPIILSATIHEPLWEPSGVKRKSVREGRPNSKKYKAKRKTQRAARRLNR